ncbi:hypothetical protein [Pyrococcus abyssi]|uniref:Uncharacterized protein n=1 Tax=Pyrococcus abyssi (strain GE5 / Orsay) TaxID=272844 RepID=Q9V068_PYRAB|nr:hypothetical protein [Pyrococcus abyssi]CAB49837.1 Hypothetical protein PAB0618 [Pyrococcus abyssi GE5]CCE70331.1 TPA: hypothetical protein PAB0618 [Pyrococcus abyssi GE5]
MEEVRELKEVLDKVERKLIAGFHVYTALVYSAWLAAIGGYLLLTFLRFEYLGMYWLIAIALIIGLTIKVYTKYISSEHGEEKLGYAWIVGWILGGISWVLLGDARGLATMIVLGHVGMFVSFRENSMLIPLALALVLLKPSWELADALIVLTYSLTALVNLYKAFRVI